MDSQPRRSGGAGDNAGSTATVDERAAEAAAPQQHRIENEAADPHATKQPAAEEVPPPVDAGPMERGCLICMAAEPSDATAIKGCGHQFCYVCIHTWGATRRAPTCPVCRGTMGVLVLADGTEQPVVPASAAATDEGPDLSCLDHAYFLSEVSRLVSRAEAVRARLYRDTMNCGRRGDANSERSLAGLSEVLARLDSYRLGLSGDHPPPFEAEPLLHDLYQLDRMVTSLSTGSTEGLEDLHAYQAGAPPRVNSWWDDGDYCSDDDDDGGVWGDDCGDDDFDARSLGRAASGLRNGSLSRTPGRRPVQRGGSGRGGGGGGGGGGGTPASGGRRR